MTFIKNNRELVFLSLLIAGMFAMGAAIGLSLAGADKYIFHIFS